MDWNPIKARLERILQAPLAIVGMPEWPEPAARSIVKDHKIWFRLPDQGGDVVALTVEEVLATPSERELVELLLDAFERGTAEPADAFAETEERRMTKLGGWLLQQLQQGNYADEPPEPLTAKTSWHSSKVPVLLYGEYASGDEEASAYDNLLRLLETFFEDEVLLVPLHEREWLILAPESALQDGDEEDADPDSAESQEENLTLVCLGLSDMLASEWGGTNHLAIDLPIVPAKSMLASVARLRETMHLGRMFHVGQTIHLPWELELERFLNRLSNEQKNKFVQQILKRIDLYGDQETMSTLEQFFELDCNVSETAKKLYIHRNTLLYRLDKFKQETGYDVRKFSDAVLVKIALLLYKVTKRQ